MDISKEMQTYIHLSKYARWVESENRRETWDETIDRFLSFWKEKYDGNNEVINKINVLTDNIRKRKIMPSMRVMMTAGKALKRDEAACYNCSAAAITHPRIFDECFYLLMCGCGFGFSVERQYINKLPEIDEEMYESDSTIVVRDSKIGWATSLKELISMLYNGQIPKWDLNRVRSAGTRLKTFGGRASGPEPLNKLFEFTVRLFKNAKGRKLRSIECHDLICKIAETVIVGSVRRSATISLSNLTDDRMRRAKTGNWWTIEPQRSLANNSVAYTEKPDLDAFSKEWRTLYKSKSGERGIINKVALKEKAEKCGREHNGDYIINPSLRGNTRVWTDKGIFQIEMLKNFDYFNVRNKNNEIVPAKCWKSGNNIQLWNIELKGGHLYQCSPQHKWPVFSNSKNRNTIIKKEANEIVAGDIIIKNGYHDYISLIDSQKRDRDIGYLIGWCIGDGWKTVRKNDGTIQYGIIVSNEDKENCCDKTISKTLKEVCGWKGTLSNKNEIGLNNKNVNLLFEEVKFKHKREGLPVGIWSNCSEEKIRGIIDGLFSSDGCIADNYIEFTTAHHKLAKDVSELLGFYGITTTIHKTDIESPVFPNGKTYDRNYIVYAVRINKYLDICHFHSLFVLTHKSKNNKIEKLIKNDKNVYFYNDSILVKKSYLSNEYDDVYDISVKDDTATFQLAHSITGNCGEAILRDTGGFCNLTEVIVRENDTLDTLKEKVYYATQLGLLQSTLTNFRYLRKVWKNNAEEDRILGVSLTGIMDHSVLCGKNLNLLNDYLKELKQTSQKANIEMSKTLNINPAFQLTLVKPSGTVSLLCDTSSGIHPRYSEFYIRRTRNDKKDPLSQLMIDQGFNYVDDGDKYIFDFYIKSPDSSIRNGDLTAIEQLNIWKAYRNVYCDGNPSQTIYYTDDEFFAVADWVWNNWNDIGGLSFFPKDDHIYENAPYEPISKEKYEELIKTFPEKIEWEKLPEYETEDVMQIETELACAGGACEL